MNATYYIRANNEFFNGSIPSDEEALNGTIQSIDHNNCLL